MNLVLNIKSACDTLKDHQEPFDSYIENDVIRLNPRVGEGYIQGVPLANGISIILYDITLKQTMHVKTRVEKDADTYSIFLNVLSNAVQKQVGESQESISRHSSTGLFFYSPDNASQAVYQPDERYVLLFVTFTREGLRLLIDSPKIQALLSPEHTFTYFQEVDLHLENIVKQIFGSREALFHKMQLLGQTLLLIEHVLQKSITENPHNLAGFLEEDVLKLFQARELLTVRYGNPPTIVELSHTLGMNETKLKKSFKQVFNTSIYQYSQYARMLKAKELLESRRHTASEVAYLVGYNNLTHFGEAFKKHFQTLPGQYLSSVLQSYT